MIPVMEFSEPAVLKALLNKTKVSTMRIIKTEGIPTDEKFSGTVQEFLNKYGDSFYYRYEDDTIYSKQEKPPKWNVGDEVSLEWTGSYSDLLKYQLEQTGYISRHQERDLGKVRITKVEKICVFQDRLGNHIASLEEEDFPTFDVRILAPQEGFKDSDEMFSFLEKYCGDLSNPKKLYLYSWVWL